MTPAVIEARRHGVEIEIHEYDHDPRAASYGEEAAEKMDVDVAAIYKTLVVQTDHNALAVGIVPVMSVLDLKAMANALGVKKVQMADKDKVERSTGYVLGGVSPLGQKKKLTTVLDRSAESQQIVYVSGGRRGLDIAIAPHQLVALCRATYDDISRSEK
jgi:Cys-tRNA(Pro)/Cys-tRNA(Cys) deacylase